MSVHTIVLGRSVRGKTGFLTEPSPMIIGNLDGMVRAIRDGGRQPMLLNVPYANESMFPRRVAEELHAKRDYHNDRLGAYCVENQVPLVDIASKLRDEHFADELHPNDEGAQVIAQEVFRVFSEVQKLDALGRRTGHVLVR